MFSALGNLITTPFAWLFRWLYDLTGSYGLAIIGFTLVIKLVLLPFQMKTKRSSVRMGRLAGKQKELEKKYANNKQKYQEELSKLYLEEGINPMGSCLWSFIPLFILIPLYSIIRKPLTSMMLLGEEAVDSVRTAAEALGYVAGEATAYEEVALARFVTDRWTDFEGKFEGLIPVNFDFLGGLDLSVVPGSLMEGFEVSWPVVGVLLIPVVSALLSWFSTKVIMASNGQKSSDMQSQMKMMNLMMPLMSLWIGFTLPAALGVYWIASTVFSMIQEKLLGRFYLKKIEDEEEERESQREAQRQARMEEARKRAQAQREEELRNPGRHKPKPESKPKEKKVSTNEAGRVGDRPYARGRSYVENRYEQE